MPYFGTRLPSSDEKKSCRWVTFTSDRDWEPYLDHFQKSEDATTAFYSDPYQGLNRPTHEHQGEPIQINAMNTINNTHFVSAVSTIHLDDHESFDIEPPFHYIKATSSKERRTNIPHLTLARRWGTSMDTV